MYTQKTFSPPPFKTFAAIVPEIIEISFSFDLPPKITQIFFKKNSPPLLFQLW
jgi:hypothetical protein